MIIKLSVIWLFRIVVIFFVCLLKVFNIFIDFGFCLIIMCEEDFVSFVFGF